jgi:hypothetical protein
MRSEPRVVRDIDGCVSVRYALLDGKRVKKIAPMPVSPEAPSLQDLQRVLADMRAALARPILDEKDFS